MKRREQEAMRKLLVTAALGAAFIAAPALAQTPAGMQRDQTRQEAQQRADMMFQMMDANHDGTVTRAEAEQAAAQFAASRGGDNARGGGRIQRMIDQAFGTAQSLTLAQFEAQMLARFDAQDLNRDGTVTSDERRSFREQQGQPRQNYSVVLPPPPAAPPAQPHQ
jgi:hypothetical protein